MGVVLLADVEVEEVVVADVALVLVDVATLVDVVGTATGVGGAAVTVAIADSGRESPTHQSGRTRRSGAWIPPAELGESDHRRHIDRSGYKYRRKCF